MATKKVKIEKAEEVNLNHIGNWDQFISSFPKPAGSYGYDAWGFNIKGVLPFMKVGKWFYEHYFRVQAFGLEHVPKEGRVLIIGNHSGQLPIDAMMLGYTLVTNPYAPRAPKGMMEFFVPQVPFISTWFSRWGGIVGDPENCRRLLQKEEAILVFPEGARGISKPNSKKYQLERFGNGFMRMALENDAPIIPVGIVGCEEIMYQLGDIKPLAKVLRLPVFPILAPVILPSKIIIHIGKPIHFKVDGEIREYMLEEKVNHVKDEINKLIKLGLEKRNSIFDK
ncbi:MAG: acyltransferase family protein [Chitinophagales bacterium]|nr:acyltransferase family protein [Chitinophagales bacterium]